MKTTLIRAALLSLAAVLASRPAAAGGGEWTGNLNVLLGAKALDKEYWEPADEQAELGIEADLKKKDWPVSIAVDYLEAFGEGEAYLGYTAVTLESETSELNVGLRKIWDGSERTRPFIGGGLSFASAIARVRAPGLSASNSDKATGFWLGGGVYWLLGDGFNLGLEAKSSSAKVFDGDGDAGGGHFGILLGWHWGGHTKNRTETVGKTAPPEQPYPPRAEQPAPRAEAPDGQLELEKQRLELEKQKLQLEREKFEFEKQKSKD